MEAVAHPHPAFAGRRAAHGLHARRIPSMLATAMSYFIILYLYSSAAWVVMLVYPSIKVAYFLYFLLATVPFLAAVNRSVVNVFHDHWPFVALIAVYFAYVSFQYALLGMAAIPTVREAYFEKGQFLVTILFSLIAFELCFDFRQLLKLLYGVVVFSSVMNVIEFFDPAALPIRLTYVPGRAAGFYFNPNIAAMFIASTIPLVCARMGALSRILFYGITGVGTFLSFSRGGWVLWFVAVLMTEAMRVDWRKFRLTANNIGLIAAGLIGAILLATAAGPAFDLLVSGLGSRLDANTSTRLALVTTETTIDRFEIARQGLIAFTQAPIFGNGVGYTWQWVFGLSVHDMFVLMLAEQGILGFLWLMALLVVWYRYPSPYGWWLVILFVVAAFATHNYFDGAVPAILVCLYLVAASKFGVRNGATIPRVARR